MSNAIVIAHDSSGVLRICSSRDAILRSLVFAAALDFGLLLKRNARSSSSRDCFDLGTAGPGAGGSVRKHGAPPKEALKF